MVFCIVRKLRRNLKCFLFGLVLLGAVAVYNEVIGAARQASGERLDEVSSGRVLPDKEFRWNQLPDSINDTSQTLKSKIIGRANLHVFEDWCGRSVADLRKNVHFPIRPHTRTTVQKLAVSPEWTNYGLRIFGYLHPYADGEFVFAVSSDDNSEFWLSTDDSPHNVRLLAWVGRTGAEWTAPGEFNKFSSQTSRPVRLSAEEKYFFEVLHKQDDRGIDHVEVAWKLLSNNSGFTVIESSHLTVYMNETSPQLIVADIPQTAASHQYVPSKEKENKIDMEREDPRDTFYKVPLMKDMFLRGVLPDCDYKPTYTIKGRPLKRYEGLQYVHMSFIYPNDHTRLTHLDPQDSCFYPEKPSLKRNPVQINEFFDPRWSQTFDVKYVNFEAKRSDGIDLKCEIKGNLLLSSSETLPLVQAFMNKLDEKHPGLFTLVRVVNVVKRADGAHGSRYLLELEVKDKNGQVLRLSHYIYTSVNPTLTGQSKNSGDQATYPPNQPVLCNPVGLEWNPAATVNIVVTVKGQGRWVHQLISEMEKVYRISGDTNFNLIIVDFDSSDIDVKKTLQEATLPRYQYIKLNGSFLKTTGLQAGINSVKDEHSIIFICDLHFTFPHSFLDTIRKHTVEGRMAFTPVIMRLHCGSTPEDARGFWEVNGFGLISIYKSDLDAAGGMNTKEYTNRWGGEDWELIDRVLQAGLEVERIYVKNFFHFFHSKRGMWNN